MHETHRKNTDVHFQWNPNLAQWNPKGRFFHENFEEFLFNFFNLITYLGNCWCTWLVAHHTHNSIFELNSIFFFFFKEIVLKCLLLMITFYHIVTIVDDSLLWQFIGGGAFNACNKKCCNRPFLSKRHLRFLATFLRCRRKPNFFCSARHQLILVGFSNWFFGVDRD